MRSTNENKYCSRNPLKRFLINRFFIKITSLVFSFSPQNLLDVGCGEGFLAEHIMKKRPEIKITGLDISQQALKKAKKRVSSVTFKKASILKLPFSDNSFDIVLCLEVLEHLKDPLEAIKELSRVTKECCILSVPNEPLFSIFRLLGGQNILQLGQHPEHLHDWNEKSFNNFLKRVFPSVEVYKSLPWLIAKTSK